MARIEMESADMAALGAASNADILFEMGMMYATGRECEIDMIAAHKWFNIAAIKGCTRAAMLRTEIADTLSKNELARALRDAREWMTRH
ncbi:sel1 repeat family protein [Oricola sp.]|uniref:sel1 repeat family protein n=1 Tax=Oricola sp. TaxID=1979950 RepID=UPI003BAD19FA